MKKELMKAHRALALGSPEDMKAARLILFLMRRGSIVLGLSDAEFHVQTLLEDIGVPLAYGRNGYTVRAVMKKG